MKLSIILRCYNRLEFSIRTIVSIDEKSGLSKDDYEIICVDQNSTDGTNKWLTFNCKEGYYPIVPLLLSENVGDGKGMQKGINIAEGEFVAQQDSDVELVTPDYYKKLIEVYEYLERKGHKVCAVSGSHRQGINLKAAPHQFAKLRYPNNFLDLKNKDHCGYFVSWVHGSFIFKRELSDELKFDKRGCNSWCSEWWERGYTSFNCKNINFWHIDSSEKGGEYVKRQAEKFSSYSYVKKNYWKFL